MALKKSQPLTAKELADIFGVTPNALRRHLKELENEGLVRFQREVHGVGGPTYAFSLTEAGEALFPRAYENTLAEVLDLVREQQGEEALIQLFRRRWEEIARVARPELEKLPVHQRARRLADLLTSQGYMAEAHAGGGANPVLTEHNCAIRVIAERFPEVCAVEEAFIAELLGVPVTRQAHIAQGANRCEYCIESPENAKIGISRSATVPSA